MEGIVAPESTLMGMMPESTLMDRIDRIADTYKVEEDGHGGWRE